MSFTTEPETMDPKLRREIDERIRLAAEFKRKTNGKLIEDELFQGIEPDPDRKKYDGRSHRMITEKQAMIARIASWRSHRRRNGGLLGVSLNGGSIGTKRFRAMHPDMSRTNHDCAIEAAKSRNASFAAAFPDEPELQCDLLAVWKKYGCACGKHARPKGEMQ